MHPAGMPFVVRCIGDTEVVVVLGGFPKDKGFFLVDHLVYPQISIISYLNIMMLGCPILGTRFSRFHHLPRLSVGAES